ncbi:MAG TPA: hypothetical protein VGX92_01320 [Pyrinomonadaceae bacterium]|jgi:hypothetical protein|nr:hypothetical protein [Pyrinomonadaceae bacterium]
MAKGSQLKDGRAAVMFLRVVVAVAAAAVAAVIVLLLCPARPVSARGNGKEVAAPQETHRLGVRLRSFIPTASGSLHFEPTPEGGIVRLTVLGLPRAQAVMAKATTFVVWASASGGRVVRVGELQTDANGNGGLQFTRPPTLDSYSVLVTAEPNAMAEKLTGTVVFASLANEVTAFFAEVDRSVKRAQKAARELNKRARLRRPATDFYGEVDEALRTAPGGARFLQLYGGEIAPGASGSAHVTTLSLKAYVRARFQNLPLPATLNANTYVLWSIVPDGRLIYMGSLPQTGELDDTDIYVRVGGVSTDFDLLVTAEKRRPVARPSNERALSSREPPPAAQ